MNFRDRKKELYFLVITGSVNKSYSKKFPKDSVGIILVFYPKKEAFSFSKHSQNPTLTPIEKAGYDQKNKKNFLSLKFIFYCF